MLALLPPSSRVTRLTCAAAPAITVVPTSVDPVNTILRTSGWVTKRSPTTEPLPGSTWNRPAGSPASTANSPRRMVVSGVHLGRLHQHRVARGQRGRETPRRDGHREVPRRDDADDAQRLVEGDVQTAGDRNLLAGQPFRARRVKLQHVADVAGLPLRVADRVTGVRHLERGQLIDVRVDRGRERAQRRRPARRAPAAPNPLRRTWRAPPRRRRRPTSVSSTVRSSSSVAGLITCRRVTRSFLRPSPIVAAASTTTRRTAAGRPAVPRDAIAPRKRRASPGNLDRLDDTVGVLRADDQAVAEPGDRLMVIALCIGGFADQRRQPGARHRAHRRGRRTPRCPSDAGCGRSRREDAGAGCRPTRR